MRRGLAVWPLYVAGLLAPLGPLGFAGGDPVSGGLFTVGCVGLVAVGCWLGWPVRQDT